MLVEGNAKKNQKTRTFWYQNDHLGTPHSLTDSLGALVYSCTYNAYGQVQTETQHQQQERGLRVETNLRFQGQYADEETGLFYNLNRYYDPGLGRYLTADPIGLLGGVNQYQYVDGNPINAFDPLGLLKTDTSGQEVILDNKRGSITFPPTVSAQKQQRHLKGTAPENKGYLENIEDAQKVLDEYRAGNYRFITENLRENEVTIEVPSVTGTHVNVGNPNGLPDLVLKTNVFKIQSIKSPKIVPVNPTKGSD